MELLPITFLISVTLTSYSNDRDLGTADHIMLFRLLYYVQNCFSVCDLNTRPCCLSNQYAMSLIMSYEDLFTSFMLYRYRCLYFVKMVLHGDAMFLFFMTMNCMENQP